MKVIETVKEEKRKASKVDLDNMADNFGDDGLQEGTGEANPTKKPKRTNEKVPTAPKPKTKVKARPQTIPERLEEMDKPTPQPKKVEEVVARQIVTETDGHTYSGDDLICRICGLEKGNTTTVCFGRPLFRVTLKKFNEGKLDYNGTSWIPRKK